MNCRRSWPIIAMAWALWLGGCGKSGPDVGYVTGIVRMDGEPLPYATVEFYPEQGRPSVGTTDEQGRFELSYSATRKGALLGTHSARVSTVREKGQFTGPDGKPLPEMGEKVGASYNQESQQNPEMRFEVKRGRNTIDLEVKSSKSQQR